MSRVERWIRIRLPVQGTRVRSVVWEDPLCLRATKPCTTAVEPVRLEPALEQETLPAPKLESSLHSPGLEQSLSSSEDPAQTNTKLLKKRKAGPSGNRILAHVHTHTHMHAHTYRHDRVNVELPLVQILPWRCGYRLRQLHPPGTSVTRHGSRPQEG